MAINIVIPASCATLSSAPNVTMLSNMLMVAMVSASGLPASYVTVAGVVNNTCVRQTRRRRSLLQQLSYAPPPSQADGTATVKINVTWPFGITVTPTAGSTSPAQADLIIANCTSHQALSSFFTPSFMAAYEIRSTPYALTAAAKDDASPSSALRYNSAASNGNVFEYFLNGCF